MADEYETFARDAARLLSGNEVAMTLRDLTPGKKKYCAVNVRGAVSRRDDDMPVRRLPVVEG